MRTAMKCNACKRYCLHTITQVKQGGTWYKKYDCSECPHSYKLKLTNPYQR